MSGDRSVPGDIEQFLRTVPRQRRSVARLAAILDGVGDVLEEGGAQALSMTAVSAASGVPLASIYDYFTDTKSMVGAFCGWNHQENLGDIAEIVGPDLQADQITATFTRALEHFRAQMRNRPGSHHADAICDADPELHAFRLHQVRVFADLLEASIRPHVPEEIIDKLAPRALLGTYLVTSLSRLTRAVDPDEAKLLIDMYVEVFLDPLPVR